MLKEVFTKGRFCIAFFKEEFRFTVKFRIESPECHPAPPHHCRSLPNSTPHKQEPERENLRAYSFATLLPIIPHQ